MVPSSTGFPPMACFASRVAPPPWVSMTRGTSTRQRTARAESCRTKRQRTSFKCLRRERASRNFWTGSRPKTRGSRPTELAFPAIEVGGRHFATKRRRTRSEACARRSGRVRLENPVTRIPTQQAEVRKCTMVDTYLRLRHPRRYQRDDRAVAFGHFDLGA